MAMRLRGGVDVVVVGGGTAGVITAIAAGRTGADTLKQQRRNIAFGPVTVCPRKKPPRQEIANPRAA